MKQGRSLLNLDLDLKPASLATVLPDERFEHPAGYSPIAPDTRPLNVIVPQ